MGHLYQLKAYGDRAKLRPLHSYAYGDDAVRLEVRSGLLTREVAALRKLGGKVEAHDPRETNKANIAARHLVREYAAGRAVLAESEPLGQPTGKATVRVCLAHVGGGELDALTALGNTLTPKNRQDSNPALRAHRQDSNPALRALRYLIRAYANGALTLNPKQPS